MHLFRPTGLQELLLVLRRDLGGWPPRLPEQPIFYPVLNLPYAVQIARDWNTKSDALVGYVTAFEIDDSYAARFERKVVGGRQHEELWVPAEELEDFNRHLLVPIRVVDAYFAPAFQGLAPTSGALAGKDATQQLAILREIGADPPRLAEEVRANREAVFLHVLFWESLGRPTEDVLTAVRAAWREAFPALPLPERETPAGAN